MEPVSDVKTTVTEIESVDFDVTEDMETDSRYYLMLSPPVSATAKAALLSNRGPKLIDYHLLIELIRNEPAEIYITYLLDYYRNVPSKIKGAGAKGEAYYAATCCIQSAAIEPL